MSLMACPPDVDYSRLAAHCHRERWRLGITQRKDGLELHVRTDDSLYAEPFTAGREGDAARALLSRLPTTAE